MFHIVLVHPEIPPNTGNVIRLAANTGARLHLVEPLGFTMDDRQLRRAGLDYHEFAHVQVHRSYPHVRRALNGHRMFAFSTRGTRNHAEVEFRVGDAFVFGPETKGLAPERSSWRMTPIAQMSTRGLGRPGSRICSGAR